MEVISHLQDLPVLDAAFWMRYRSFVVTRLYVARSAFAFKDIAVFAASVAQIDLHHCRILLDDGCVTSFPRLHTIHISNTSPYHGIPELLGAIARTSICGIRLLALDYVHTEAAKWPQTDGRTFAQLVEDISTDRLEILQLVGIAVSQQTLDRIAETLARSAKWLSIFRMHIQTPHAGIDTSALSAGVAQLRAVSCVELMFSSQCTKLDVALILNSCPQIRSVHTDALPRNDNGELIRAMGIHLCLRRFEVVLALEDRLQHTHFDLARETFGAPFFRVMLIVLSYTPLSRLPQEIARLVYETTGA